MCRVARFLTVLFAAVFAASWSTGALAFSYVLPPDHALHAQADGVLVATVAEELAPSHGPGLPERRWAIEVERVLAGKALADARAVLRLPGTPAHAERRLFVPGIPELQPGERVLLFHVRGPGGDLRALQLSLGLFFETVTDSGKRAYIRTLDDDGAVGDGRFAAYARGRDADRFERWIAGGAAKGAPDYLLAPSEKALRAAPKFNLTRSSLGHPIRWFDFDTGGSVEWRALNGSPAGSDFVVDAALAAGLNAWSSDPDSRINLTYNSTRLSDDPGIGSANGVNAVVWDDPDNNIPGSFDCINMVGVLGFGGQFFFTSTKRFDGSHYHDADEGFVILQDGIGCFAISQDRAEELFTHEFGHTLGFAHPCGDPGQVSCSRSARLNEATMRGLFQDDGRGASLRADDRAAALRLYPSPSFVHPLETDIVSPTGGSTPAGAGMGTRMVKGSSEGRYIIVQTDAILPGYGGDNNGADDIYVIDTETGCIRRASLSDGPENCGGITKAGQPKGAQIPTPSIEPSVSANGELVVFVAQTGAVAKVRNESATMRSKRLRAKATDWSVFMRNMSTGNTFMVGTANVGGTGSAPQVTADGQSIFFVSNSQPPAVETAGGGVSDPEPDVFQAKPVGGNPDNGFTVTCVSCKNDPGKPAAAPTVNANGGMTAYSLGGALWLQNMTTGGAQPVVTPPTGSAGTASAPQMDFSGGNVVFQSNLPLDADGTDNQGKDNVYLFELCCNKITRISKPDTELNNPASQLPSLAPTISGDGKQIAFVSAAQNLMGFAPENNPNQNVYVVEVESNLARRYSRGSDGSQSNGDSFAPFLDYSGSNVLFASEASNLDAGTDNGMLDAFARSNPLAEFVVFGSGFE